MRSHYLQASACADSRQMEINPPHSSSRADIILLTLFSIDPYVPHKLGELEQTIPDPGGLVGLFGSVV